MNKDKEFDRDEIVELSDEDLEKAVGGCSGFPAEIMFLK